MRGSMRSAPGAALCYLPNSANLLIQSGNVSQLLGQWATAENDYEAACDCGANYEDLALAL